jgi:hypothetical protein
LVTRRKLLHQIPRPTVDRSSTGHENVPISQADCKAKGFVILPQAGERPVASGRRGRRFFFAPRAARRGRRNLYSRGRDNQDIDRQSPGQGRPNNPSAD